MVNKHFRFKLPEASEQVSVAVAIRRFNVLIKDSRTPSFGRDSRMFRVDWSMSRARVCRFHVEIRSLPGTCAVHSYWPG